MQALGDDRKVMPQDNNLHLQPPHSTEGHTRTLSGRLGYDRSVASAPAVRQSMRLERQNTRLKNAHQGTGNKNDIAGGCARSSIPPERRRIGRSQLTKNMRCTEADPNVHVEDDLTQELNNDPQPRAHKQKKMAYNSTTLQPDSSCSKRPTSQMNGIANSVRQGRRVVPRRTISLVNDEPSVIPSSLHLQASDQTNKSKTLTGSQQDAVPTEIASDTSVQPSRTALLRTGRVTKHRNPALLDGQKSRSKSERIPCSTSELLNNANSKLQLMSQYQPEEATSSSIPEPAMPTNLGTDFRKLKELFSEEDEERSSDLSEPDEDILNDPDMMQILFPIFGTEAFQDSSSLAYAFSSDAEYRCDSDSSDTSYSHQRRRESRSRQLSQTPRVVQSQERKRSLDLYALEVEVDGHPKNLGGRDRMQSNSSGSIEDLCFSTRTESKDQQVETGSEESELYGLRNPGTEIKTETEAAMLVARSEQRLDNYMVDTTGNKSAAIPHNTSDEDEELPPTQLIDDEAAWFPSSQPIRRVSAHCSSGSVAMAAPKMSMLSSIESFESLPLIQPLQSQSGVLPSLSSNGGRHSAQSTKQLYLCATKFDEHKAFLAELDQEFPKTKNLLSQTQDATSEGTLHLMESQSIKWKGDEAANDDENITEKVGQERLRAENIKAMARAHIKGQQDIDLITQVQIVDSSAIEVRPDTIDMRRVEQTSQGQNTDCISEDPGAQANENAFPHWSSLHGRRARKRRVISTTPPEVHVHDNFFVPDTAVESLAIKSSEKSRTEIVKAAADSSVVKHTSSSYCDNNSDVYEVIEPLPSTQIIKFESSATTQIIESSDINSTANKPLTDTYISPNFASVIAAEMPETELSNVESNDSATRSNVEILDSRPKYSSLPTRSHDPRLSALIPIWLSDKEESEGQEYISVADDRNSSEASQAPCRNEKNSLSDMYASEGANHIVSNEDEEKSNDDGSTRHCLRQRRPPTQFSPRPIVPNTGKTRRQDKFSPDYLLNNAKSALVDLPDLSMFISEDAFRKLSIDDRRDIMRYILPIDRASSTSPVPGFFSNVVIQDATRQLQADIGLGRYTKAYAEEYKRATAAIANGEADEYKEGQFELWWGQKSRGINV
ncbi:uncharacterized protein V1513DRAFT_485336 [Lipomyces chichibuensis]|uniref:uncharacterized protein n=1 Tax=Lipomyces chichibuensis TaxID=1546026 RepID=UPI003342FCB0